MNISDVKFVKELYPRKREDDAAVERYRAAIDKLPPITVARGHILVDGYHRVLAYQREKRTEIEAEDLGNLSDTEILKESIRRNASHGRQLETNDKKAMADRLYRMGTQEIAELMELLSLTEESVKTYIRDARRDEKAQQKSAAWDLWLDCLSEREIEEKVGIDHSTVSRVVLQMRNDPELQQPPASRQHFDVWNFATTSDDAGTASFFGKMPPQIVENLLWLYTEPGQIVFDPFAGGGTTIEVAKRMGRRVWSSDRKPSTETLPIHQHDILAGWPKDAPAKADFILLDPPYWKQAEGKYSSDAADLGNTTLEAFMAAWKTIVKTCAKHVSDGGHLAFVISPTQLEDGGVVDHAMEMAFVCKEFLPMKRRIIATYNTQQATGQQVTWARENKRLLKLYRDVVVFSNV